MDKEQMGQRALELASLMQRIQLAHRAALTQFEAACLSNPDGPEVEDCRLRVSAAHDEMLDAVREFAILRRKLING